MRILLDLATGQLIDHQDNQNEIHPFIFAAAVRELLKKGRGKFRNIFIHEPANTAKSFMLKPLEDIFKVFCNPANDKYA